MNINSSYKSNLMLAKKIISFFRVFFLLILIQSCAIWDPADVKDVPVNVEERAARALEEGKGIKLGDLGSRGSSTFEFATSNVMWRATLETLEFLPLANVDYGGGIISTDWYNEGTANNESIKITVRFLSNEIRADGLKIIVHKKICSKSQNCTVNKISSILEQELAKAILREATLLEKEMRSNNRKAYQKKYGKRKKKLDQDNTKN